MAAAVVACFDSLIEFTTLMLPAMSRSSVRSRGIALPDMAPFAGLIFLLVCFYLLAGQFKQTGDGADTGIVALEQLPATPFSCYKPLDPNGFGGCVISLNAANHFSFALPGTGQSFQAKVIEQVAIQHGIRFTPPQLAQIQSLPFLACDVEQLPILLTIPAREGQKLIEEGVLGHLSKKELGECIAATRKLAPKLMRWQVYFYLKVHADAKTPHFYDLTDLLQAQGINRYNLLTQARE
jgi:hypothetical protein